MLPIFAPPAGSSMLYLSRASITSIGDRLRAWSFCRSRNARTVRIRPPYTTGAFDPGDAMTMLRTWYRAVSYSVDSSCDFEFRATMQTGVAEVGS